MNIVEFLEARIAEDAERAGSGWSRLGDTRWETDNYGRNFLTPAAVLAECKAKRAILKQAEEADSETEYSISQSCINEAECEAARATAPGKLIREALAAVYADHPDYREEWRHA